jgi:hypothetical protein
MFQCFDCGSFVGPLIQGSCRFCEPELHAAFEAHLKDTGEQMAAYERATGRRALDDYDAYEAWLRGPSIYPPGSRAGL